MHNKIRATQVVLDINCGTEPQNFFTPKLLHICCESRPEALHTLQRRVIGNPQTIIMPLDGQALIAGLGDKSVDSVFINDIHVDYWEQVLPFVEMCERVTREQIILRGSVSAGALPAALSDPLWELLADDAVSTDRIAFSAIKTLPPVDTTQLPTKIAVLSFDHLPKDSGQAIMLGRLLQHVDPASYCQLSLQDHRSHTFPNMHIPHRTDGLPAPFFRIAEAIFHQKWEYRNGATRKQQLVELARAVLHVWKNARSIARIIKKERCKLIVGCSGSIVDLPAAYLASKLASVPFIAYFFDYYSYQAIVPLYKPFTHFAERLVVTGADAVIVPNEHLADEYRRRYGVQAVVIHNPLDDEQSVPVDSEQIDPVEIGTDTLSIVYTGQVYDAHYDAFITLVQAMERLNDPRLKLHIYTAQPVEVLQNAGIRGAVVFHPHLPQSAIRPVQRQADVLFLPLAFNSPYPEIIRTSAPSKLGEYLISGRPILAHVPKGSFVASYLREHNCGLVVDDQDPQLLAEALQKLVRDAELRTTLVRNAQQRASIDFNGYHARAALFSLIGSATKTDS